MWARSDGEPLVELVLVAHGVEARRSGRPRAARSRAPSSSAEQHGAVGRVVDVDQPVRERRGDVEVAGPDPQALVVLDDQVRIEGVLGAAADVVAVSGGSSRRTVSLTLTRCSVDGTPSRLIAIPARTEVPPRVARMREPVGEGLQGRRRRRRSARRPRPWRRSRGSTPRGPARWSPWPVDVSSAARMPYSATSCSRTSAVSVSSWSTQPPRPRTTRDASAMSVERGLAGGAEQLDLVRGDHLHGLDARRLDGVAARAAFGSLPSTSRILSW